MRAAETFEQWWAAASDAARKFGFARLSLQLANRDGACRTLVWHQFDGLDTARTFTMILPVRDRRAGAIMQARLESVPNGSLESVARMATYFSRLMDENSPASLSPPLAGPPAGVSYELVGPPDNEALGDRHAPIGTTFRLAKKME